MLPVVALVGRPNVGKSTLFNALTGTRDALVADIPGVTRDRKYGYGRSEPHQYIVIDTGGLVEAPRGVLELMARQTGRAIEEADRIVFLVDGQNGLDASDRFVADVLRRSGKPVTVAVNKSEDRDGAVTTAEFHSFGFGEPLAISAAHRQGIDDLMERTLAGIEPAAADTAAATDGTIRVCVIGRPNVGKSTLINRLVGEERLITFDEPGTTRDAVEVPFERDGQGYVLIDTAGVRRRARVEKELEKWSVIKTLQAIDDAHVVICVVDARSNVAEQDATLFGIAAERGRALVVAVNKWDHVEPGQRDEIRGQLAAAPALPRFRALPFHLGAARQRRRRVDGLRSRRACGGDAGDADARAHAHPRGGDPPAPAAAGSRPADPAALCAPGRPQSARHRRSRRPGRAHAGGLPALPDQLLSRGVQAEGYARAGGLQERGQSVRGSTRQADAAPAAHARAADAPRTALNQAFGPRTRARSRPSASRASTSVPGGASDGSRTTLPFEASVTIA